MATVEIGEFEWDSEKATQNARKHGVTFVEAMRAFEDPNGLTAPDRDAPQTSCRSSHQDWA